MTIVVVCVRLYKYMSNPEGTPVIIDCIGPQTPEQEPITTETCQFEDFCAVAAQCFIEKIGVDDTMKIPLRALFNYEVEKLKPTIDEGEFLGVAMLDVNNLKITNDGFGHPQGDKFLESIGKKVRASLRLEENGHNGVTHKVRPEDLVGRTGGDEIVIILRLGNNATKEEADNKAEAFLERFKKTLSGGDLREVSIGMVVAPYAAEVSDEDKRVVVTDESGEEGSMTIEQMIHKADEKMYEDKTGIKAGIAENTELARRLIEGGDETAT